MIGYSFLILSILLILDKINARRQAYKKVVNGREDLWGEYCRLRKEVKQLVVEKKLNIWNELVEKVNTDFDENRKEFWAFVGRKSKGKKKNIASLKSDIYWVVFNEY